MPHEKLPPQGWYRVAVHLNGEWTNVDHNLGGRQAFELVHQWRAQGDTAHYVSQHRQHVAPAANTCPDCAMSLARWKQRQEAEPAKRPITPKASTGARSATSDPGTARALGFPHRLIPVQTNSGMPNPQRIHDAETLPSMSTACEGKMIATVWTNGNTELGLKISAKDRDQFFKKDWSWVSLELEGLPYPVEVNIGKPSFWRWGYAQLVSRDLGDWITANGMAYWPPRKPPKLNLELMGDRRFRVLRQRVNIDEK